MGVSGKSCQNCWYNREKRNDDISTAVDQTEQGNGHDNENDNENYNQEEMY